MKKALLPLLVILAAIVALALAGYLYDQQFGPDGPFDSDHSHGGGHDADDQDQDHTGHDHE